jgi:creatinine amidohydrolase/Fe(II)-dependent formamide hydrolase-like protein
MPSFSDGYAAERITLDVADAIVAKPGWSVVIFPMVPLGSNAANEIGGKYSFDGSYTVRAGTLRFVFMDLGSDLGEGGFQWIFVVSSHGGSGGGLYHSRAIDQACDYFEDTYGGHMVNLLMLMREKSREVQEKLRLLRVDDGFCPHACGSEVGRALYLLPQLVDPGYQSAAPITSGDWAGAIRAASRENWPGYFGSPAAASAANGAQRWQLQESPWFSDLALKILDGLDYHKLPRYGDVMAKNPETTSINQGALEHELQMQRKQQEWLRKKGLQ